MLPSHVAEPSNPRSRNRSTLLIALAVQVAVLLVTLVVVVREEAEIDPPAFSGERVVAVERPQVKRMERVRELSRRMSKPRSFQRLAVEEAFQAELPALPAMPQSGLGFSAIEESFVSEAQSSLMDSSLLDLMAGMAGGESSAEFFGIKDSGRKIVIVVNTSASVVRKAAARGVSVEQLQDEAIRVLEGLESGTLFGLVQFSQGTKVFSGQLAPALVRNKSQGVDWIRRELRGNPKVGSGELLGHEAGLAAALAFQPDLVFLVTDGSLNKRVRKEGGGYAYPKISFEALLGFVDRKVLQSGTRPKLHVIGFELGEVERSGLKRLARRFGGSLREL